MPRKVDYFAPLIGTTFDADEFHSALGALRADIDFPETSRLTYKIETPPKKDEHAKGPISPAVYKNEEILVLRKITDKEIISEEAREALKTEYDTWMINLSLARKELREDKNNKLLQQQEKIARQKFKEYREEIRIQEYLLADEVINSGAVEDEKQAARATIEKVKKRLNAHEFLHIEGKIQVQEIIGIYRVYPERPIRITIAQRRELNEAHTQMVGRVNNLNKDMSAVLRSIRHNSPAVAEGAEFNFRELSQLYITLDIEKENLRRNPGSDAINKKLGLLQGEIDEIEARHNISAPDAAQMHQLASAIDSAKGKVKRYSQEMRVQNYLQAVSTMESERASPNSKKAAKTVIEKTKRTFKTKDPDEVIKVYGILPRYALITAKDKWLHSTVSYFLGVTAERYVNYIHTFYEGEHDGSSAFTKRIPTNISRMIFEKIVPEKAELQASNGAFYLNLEDLSAHLASIVQAIAEPYRQDNDRILDIIEEMFEPRHDMEIKLERVQLVQKLVTICNAFGLNGDEVDEFSLENSEMFMRHAEIETQLQQDLLEIKARLAEEVKAEAGADEVAARKLLNIKLKPIKAEMYEKAAQAANVIRQEMLAEAGKLHGAEEAERVVSRSLQVYQIKDMQDRLRNMLGAEADYIDLTAQGIKDASLDTVDIQGPNQEMQLTLRMLILSGDMVMEDYRCNKLAEEIEVRRAQSASEAGEKKVSFLEALAPKDADIERLEKRLEQHKCRKAEAEKELETISTIIMAYSTYQSYHPKMADLSETDKKEFNVRGKEIHGEIYKAAEAMKKMDPQARFEYVAEQLQESRVGKISRCRRFVLVAERRAVEVLGNESLVFESHIKELSLAARRYLNTSVSHSEAAIEAYQDYENAKTNLKMLLNETNANISSPLYSVNELHRMCVAEQDALINTMEEVHRYFDISQIDIAGRGQFADAYSKFTGLAGKMKEHIHQHDIGVGLIGEYEKLQTQIMEVMALADSERSGFAKAAAEKAAADRLQLAASSANLTHIQRTSLLKDLEDRENMEKVAAENKFSNKIARKLIKAYEGASLRLENLTARAYEENSQPVAIMEDRKIETGRKHFFERTFVGVANAIKGVGNAEVVFRGKPLDKAMRNLGRKFDGLLARVTGGKHEKWDIMPSRQLIVGQERTGTSLTKPSTRVEINNHVIENLIEGVDALITTKRRSDRAINKISEGFTRKRETEEVIQRACVR